MRVLPSSVVSWVHIALGMSACLEMHAPCFTALKASQRVEGDVSVALFCLK